MDGRTRGTHDCVCVGTRPRWLCSPSPDLASEILDALTARSQKFASQHLPASSTSIMAAEPKLLDTESTFSGMSNIVDSRLLRALADMGYSKPTLVQAKAIPLALEGRDILGRARTGSGKTAAYCISIVQKILNAKVSIVKFTPCR